MSRQAPFNLTIISAMYENGGNTTHRLLDGHPELYVYPFESQLGTTLIADYLASVFPLKYRWPEFPIAGDPMHDYELFYDEEMKVRLRTPHVSKFRDANLDLSESNRRHAFMDLLRDKPRNRAELIKAFLQATFESWTNANRSGREHTYVGYSPIVGVDADKIFADFPDAHVIHVVRNPYSSYADTKRRPFPLTLNRYVMTWNLVQHMAVTYANRYAGQFHLLRFEDLIDDPSGQMAALCQKLGLSFSPTVLYPSWNGSKLERIYPWGTIRTATPEANLATMNELSGEERSQIKVLSAVMCKLLGYEHL